jgi:hypothetical protein
MNNRFVGLSTDTKPTGVNSGATFFESNTGYMFINNGEAWVPKSYMPETTVNFKSVDIATTGAKNVMTATAQNLFIDAVVVHVPDDLSAVAGLTSMAVATDDGTPVAIMSATEGAKAKLTGDFYHVYRGPAVTESTKKIVITMVGAAGAGKIANVTVLWRPLVAGGYYLNA